MPAVVIAKADDEIVDLIDRVRSSADLDVGLVVPGSSRALQTPLNVRLLAQISNQSGRRTSIVTEDPRLQQLARASGLPVYGSVPAFERGIELAGPRAGGSARRSRCRRRRRRHGRSRSARTAARPAAGARRRSARRPTRRQPLGSNPVASSPSFRPRGRRLGDGIAAGSSTSRVPPSRSSASCCSWRWRLRRRSPSRSPQRRSR